ncbi:MAG: hypothetical protein AAFY02_05925 [Pseudomonadota bacterium]
MSKPNSLWLMSLGLLLTALLVSGCSHRIAPPYETYFLQNLEALKVARHAERDKANGGFAGVLIISDMTAYEERLRAERLAAAIPAAERFAAEVTARGFQAEEALAHLAYYSFDCASDASITCRSDQTFYPPTKSPLGTYGVDPAYCLTWVARQEGASRDPVAITVFVEEAACR